MKISKLQTAVFILYFLLSLLFTWPLVTRITTDGFGHDEDSPYHIWHNWWFKYSVFDLHQNPLHTDYIFHPQNINLIYDANAFVFSAMTLPIQFLTGNVVLASNVIFLVSFALSGLFAFFLAEYILKNRALAFLCGFIFAFNPYVLAQAIDGHTNLTTTWIIPLYTMFLIKSLKTAASIGKFQISNFKFQILAAVAASLQLYNDFTYTTFLLIETALIFIFFLIREIRQKNFVSMYRYVNTIFVVGITATVLSSPIIYEVVKATREGFKAGSPLWVQNVWAADLLTFVRPNDQTTFLTNPWTPKIGTVEGTAFLGYSVIGLLIIYLLLKFVPKLRWERNNSYENLSRETASMERLMIFLAVSFFVLMLGPSLHYKNVFQFNFLGIPFIFPLPYLLLHKIPFVGETQEPGRMFPFLILPLSILISITLKQLFDIFTIKQYIRYLLLASCFLLIIFEYLPLPFPTTDLSSKPIFDTIRKDPENKAVLVLPLGFNSGNYALGHSPIGSLQFYQAYFQKPGFRGTVARLPYSAFEYYQKIPLVSYLLDPRNDLNTESLNKENQRKIFREQLDIKYVVVMESKYKGPMGKTYEILENILGARKIYDNGDIRGYRLE